MVFLWLALSQEQQRSQNKYLEKPLHSRILIYVCVSLIFIVHNIIVEYCILLQSEVCA